MTFTWETREQWGAEPPRSRRSDTSPRGVAIHYPGPGQFTGSDHATCQARMRAWQRMHMQRGSNDLEYGLVLCEHLRLMEGRVEQDKPWVRVASNGTAAANTSHTSIQLMRGTLDPPPTDQEIAALGDAVAWLRENGGWGPEVTGHRDHYPTACPGDPLYARLGDIKHHADSPLVPTEMIVATANFPHRLGIPEQQPHVQHLADEYGASVIALQELADPDVEHMRPHGWDWWRPKRAQSAALTWSLDVWQPVYHNGKRSQGSFRLHTRRVSTPPRFVVWADLRHRGTGETLRFGSFHLVAFKTRNPAAAKEFLRQQGRLARWLRRGPNRVAAGDLNANRSLFWTPALVKDTVWEKPRVPTHGRKKIDHVLRPKGNPRPTTLGTYEGLPGDHRALIVRL